MLKTGDSLYDNPAEFAAVVAESLHENDGLTQRDFDNVDDFVSEMLDGSERIISDVVNHVELSNADRFGCLTKLYDKYGLSYILDYVLDDKMYITFVKNFDESNFDDFLKYAEYHFSAFDCEELDKNIVISVLMEPDNFTNTKQFWQNVFILLPN